MPPEGPNVTYNGGRMRNPSPLAWLWRAVLAISLVAGPVVPMTAHGAVAAPAVAAEPADAMPCHGDAPPPSKVDAPCDDGCCPQPDCDPGACRVAGPLLGAFVSLLAVPVLQTNVITSASTPPPEIALPPLLRPPIA